MTVQAEQTIQAQAFRLLKTVEAATRGTGQPTTLYELHDLGMSRGEILEAFTYLKDKGLLVSGKRLFEHAQLTAAGHDAITRVETKPDQATPAFPAITNHYYQMSFGDVTGSNIQQGTDRSSIAATQTNSSAELAKSVIELVTQLEAILGTLSLPSAAQAETEKVLTELRSASEAPAPDPSRLRRGLHVLAAIMKEASGHLVAAGALTLIERLLQ